MKMERIGAKNVFQTPSGETIVDFGQEITGYVEFTVDAKAGGKVRILHGEVLDANGNLEVLKEKLNN
ncbi:family 78 glycoside hydrolase catalytic domain [Faecalicatena orotica]|uniref:family 78 glycoside hydrolase catalytic domain n=1 Tax=Faecalicatena orotica TaxID=1544 RepID=UPI003217AD0B